MAAEERWYFTKEQLVTTPSRKCGIDPDKELSYRQQAANFIQDMGQRLQVNQLCINTAIVYVHRFYMFHSFTRFHRNAISTCALFLAAKVEEQPRKLEHVIKVAHMCLHREAPPLDSKSEAYLEQSHELISNENIMLQTLGFDVAIDHPHTHVVKCCQLVRGGGSSLHQHHASKDLAQTSYFMATNSLHLTTMCLQYKPTVVACVCIHLACKWADWEIPRSSEGKDWFWYVDKTVTVELLEELTAEFLAILDRCPSRLKRKMMSSSGTMNDKIQDTAMVEKKLAAEFAAQASSRANLAPPPPGTSAPPVKPDRHHERSSSVPVRQQTSSSNSKTTASDQHAESNATSDLMPLSSSIDKNGTPNTERKDRGIKRENNSGNSASSKAMMSTLTSLIAAPSTPPTELTPPKAIVSSPTIQKTLHSQDLGYSSLSQDNFTTNTHSSPPAVSTPKKAKLQQWGSSNAVSTASSGGSGSGRGLTPKEYREYKEQKKRERAEKKERSQSTTNHPMTATPQSIKTEVITPEKDSTKLNLSSSSSGGSCSSLTALSIARHMQPVVALTSLNISALNKVPSSKHGGLSSRHLLKTPEKQQKLIVDGGGIKREDGRLADDVTRHGIGTNHCGQSKEMAVSEDPVPALVRPPILTPSPPLATGEESKPDILDERPSSISFSSSMEETVPEESAIIPSSVKLQPPPFMRTELHKKEREEARLHTSSSSLHSTPSSGGSSSHGKPSSRRHEVTAATKERLIKHHKSKTPATSPPPPVALKVHQVATLLPTTPQTQSSIDNAISALMTSPQVPPLPFIHAPLPLHNLGTDAISLVPDAVKMDIKSEPTRTSSSTSFLHLPTNVGPVPVSQWPSSSENGSEILTQERIHQGAVTVSSASVVSRNISLHSKDPSVLPLESKGNVVVKSSSQPPLLPQPPMPPKLSRVEEAKQSLVMETPIAVKEKQSQVAVTTQGTTVPGKHEKREKHKHKDRDRERSKDKRSSTLTAAPTSKEPSPAPAIKLTIPKERFHLSTTDGLSGGNTDGNTSKSAVSGPSSIESGGGLKIKIPKGKISGSKPSKSSVSPIANVVPSASAPAPAAPLTALSISSDGPPKEGGFGLKIKITKDRLSSKGSYNLSVSGRDESKQDKSTDRSDSRKRERVPSPVPTTIHKQPLLPIPTGESSIGQIAMDLDSKPPKAAKISSRATRKSQSHAANAPYDVPPSSNTRSSLKHETTTQPRTESYNKPRTGRGGHKSGVSGGKHRGRGGGVGGMGGPPPPHPHFGGHQVNINAGPYPYTQYFPYAHQPNYFNHPMSHPPPVPHPHGPPPPPNIPPPPSVHHGHPGEYPPPPPYFGQPPYRGPPPPITGGGSSFTSQPNMMRRHIPPPLPSEPPPVIPPPPPE